MANITKSGPQEHENKITIRLWKKLSRDDELNARPTHLDPEAWELNEREEDGKIGRIDLRFLFSSGTLKPWPCFAIEAKRLHVTFPKVGWKSLVSEYVTSNTTKSVDDEQGMMCFISGRYSRGLRAGAMLGYVFDSDVKGAREQIAVWIGLHAKKLKLTPPGWVPASGVIAQRGVSESHHNLVGESEPADLFRDHFTLYHLPVPV